jgi:hypothetical protein
MRGALCPETERIMGRCRGFVKRGEWLAVCPRRSAAIGFGAAPIRRGVKGLMMIDMRLGAVAAVMVAVMTLGSPGAGMAQSAPAGKSAGARLKAAGAWKLELINVNPETMMCAASTRDNALNAVFNYLVINRRLSAFRIASAELALAPDADDAMLVLQVDERRAVAIRGKKQGQIAVLMVDKDVEAKRQFVRDMAEGKTLTVRDEAGETIGRFQLNGANTVLRAFGMCVARLPDRDAPAPE